MFEKNSTLFGIKNLLYLVFFLFLNNYFVQSQGSCECEKKLLFMQEYVVIRPTPSDINQVDGIDKEFKGSFTCGSRSYDIYSVTRCTSDFNASTSDSWPLETPQNYWPLPVRITDQELNDIRNTSYQCTTFNIEDARNCMNFSAVRWNSICLHSNPNMVAILGNFSADDSYNFDLADDPRILEGNGLAVAYLYNRLAYMCTSSTGNISQIKYSRRVLQQGRQTGERYQGIYFSPDPKSAGFVYSTSCPCHSTCEKFQCFNFCKIFQHELGHLMGLYHLDPGCPSADDIYSTMRREIGPSDDRFPTELTAPTCFMNLRCNDLCYFCKKNCPQTQCNFFVNVVEKEIQTKTYYDVNIYPNPSSKSINIAISGTPYKTINLEITNLNGRVIYKATENAIVRNMVIRADLFPQGIYFLRITDGRNITSIKKFIIR